MLVLYREFLEKLVLSNMELVEADLDLFELIDEVKGTDVLLDILIIDNLLYDSVCLSPLFRLC